MSGEKPDHRDLVHHHQHRHHEKETVRSQIHVFIPLELGLRRLLPLLREVVAWLIRQNTIGSLESFYRLLKQVHHSCVVDQIHQGAATAFGVVFIETLNLGFFYLHHCFWRGQTRSSFLLVLLRSKCFSLVFARLHVL